MGLFDWFDKKVDVFPLDEEIGIHWYDDARLKQLDKLIRHLENLAKDFKGNQAALLKITELEDIYKHLLAFYEKHNQNDMDALKKELTVVNIHEINQKEKALTDFIEQLRHIHTTLSEGFSTRDPPVEEYTEISSKNIAMPDCVKFTFENGGVLQSAREAVNYRMMKGKGDFDYYYNTRTVAIYFTDGKEYFVAFDDDPIENILLLRTKEGYDAGNKWVVDANTSMIRNAIARAKQTGRIIKVTDQNERTDVLDVAKCILGNKAQAYADFMKKQLNRDLRAWTVKKSDCNVRVGQALIRLVGLGGDRYNDYLIAYSYCDYDWRARGVQKIFSTGNQGLLVPYIGLVIYRKLGIMHDVGRLVAFFEEKERRLPAKAHHLFYASLAALIGFINKEEDLSLICEICIALSEKLSKSSPESVKHLFSSGIPLLKHLIEKPDQIHEIAEKFVEFIECCEGTEDQTMSALERLNSLIIQFGLSVFDDFLIPVAKSQTVATFQILESTKRIYDQQGIQGKNDLELIKHISKTYLTKANTILQDILIAGLDQRVIPSPISKDAEIIKVFLENAPAYILALYPAFKEIYTTSDANTRDERIFLLFKDVRQMKNDIYEGALSKRYDDRMLMSVLYFVYACHDMTVDKQNYEHTWSERQDRQADIPAALSKPISIQLSRGSFVLKNKEQEVDSEAWKLIIDAAQQIKERKAFDVATFGFQMMDALIKNSLKQQRQYFIFGVYQHSLNKGESLPEFRLEHQTLMKYKEFIGDRVANDLVFSILQESLKQKPERFYDLQMTALGRKKIDFKGLAKQIFGVMISPQPDERKDEIALRILVQNGFAVDNTRAIRGMDVAQINAWLSGMKPNVIEKGLIARIFAELYGDNYAKMQEEMSKYEFKKSARIGGGKKYHLLLSKKKTHCLAMYNMGVCVAPDEQLWNDKNFWQLMIFDDDKNAHGGAILRFIDEAGKKHLVLSVQPASSILSQTSPEQIFDKIVQAAKVIAKKMKCSDVLIPVQTTIHSNRGSIQGVIANRFKEKDKITLSREYQFSYSPYNYTYREFYRT
ncbi:MAG: hypothetical protein V1725_00025 [archaeon]